MKNLSPVLICKSMILIWYCSTETIHHCWNNSISIWISTDSRLQTDSVLFLLRSGGVQTSMWIWIEIFPVEFPVICLLQKLQNGKIKLLAEHLFRKYKFYTLWYFRNHKLLSDWYSWDWDLVVKAHARLHGAEIESIV